jgi:hypothetical protein
MPPTSHHPQPCQTQATGRLLLISFGLLTAALASAAQPSATLSSIARDTQLQASPSPRPALSTPNAAASNSPADTAKLPGDLDYGEQKILNRRAHWEPWAITTSAEYFYSDNVALASAGNLQDWHLRTGLSASYTNRIAGDWFLHGGLDAYTYLHDQYDALDFVLIRPELGILRRLPWFDDTYLSLGYVGYSISQSDLATEAFRNHASAVTLQKIWKPSRGQQLIAGLSAEYSLNAEPIAPQRHEYASYIAYRCQLTEHISATASYRASYFVYPSTDRADWNHVLVLGASYDLTDWAKLSLSASAARNISNYAFFDYDNVVTGIGLTLHIEF